MTIKDLRTVIDEIDSHNAILFKIEKENRWENICSLARPKSSKYDNCNIIQITPDDGLIMIQI